MSGGVAGAGTVRCWSIGSVVLPAGVPLTVTEPCTSTFASGGAGGAGVGSLAVGAGAPCGAKLAKNVFPGPDTNAVITSVNSWQSRNDGIEYVLANVPPAAGFTTPCMRTVMGSVVVQLSPTRFTSVPCGLSLASFTLNEAVVSTWKVARSTCPVIGPAGAMTNDASAAGS